MSIVPRSKTALFFSASAMRNSLGGASKHRANAKGRYARLIMPLEISSNFMVMNTSLKYDHVILVSISNFVGSTIFRIIVIATGCEL